MKSFVFLLILGFGIYGSAQVRPEFESLKSLDSFDRKVMSIYAVTPEELDIVFFRLQKAIEIAPDLYDENYESLYRKISWMVSVIQTNGSQDTLFQIKDIKNKLSRKLYYLEDFNGLWTYQLDIAIAEAELDLLSQKNDSIESEKTIRRLEMYLALARERVAGYFKYKNKKLLKISHIFADANLTSDERSESQWEELSIEKTGNQGLNIVNCAALF